MISKPKVSIITINYNNAEGLKKTIDSVINQTYAGIEYIIVDGGSTDGSVELITRNQDKITTWISEKDRGIYHAMNKGIVMARGEYIQFLNSGDWLVDATVVSKIIDSLPDCDIYVGNVISIRPDGRVRYDQNRKEVSMLTFYRSTLQHTSAFIKKTVFSEYGMYDESLKIVSDWKHYLIAAGLNSAKVEFSDRYVSYFDTSGISHTNLELEKAERREVLESLIPGPILRDYDKYHFAISQIERMQKYKWLYAIFWFTERCLFKWEKYKTRYLGWKKER